MTMFAKSESFTKSYNRTVVNLPKFGVLFSTRMFRVLISVCYICFRRAVAFRNITSLHVGMHLQSAMMRMKGKYQLVFDQCNSYQQTITARAIESFRNYPHEKRHFCNDNQLTKVTLLERAAKGNDSHMTMTNLQERGSRSLTLSKSTPRCETAFRPESLLSLLKDKSLGIYGDSLARQLFKAIIGATLHRSNTYYRLDRIYVNHYYRDYNANISYCEDGFGHLAARLKPDKDFRLCLQPMLETVEYIIIGVSAWYKPYFSVPPHRIRDYYENYRASQIVYTKQMETVRQKIIAYTSRVRPSLPKIIWRLSPHAGNIDEVHFLYPNRTKIYDHWNGQFWTQNYARLSAGWVLKYNEILRNISQTYGDHIFDWYSLSIYYLNFTVSARIGQKIHYDSLHYCIEGLPLASNLVLTNLIRSIQQNNETK